MKPKINTFDRDGVIYFGEDVTGVRPCRKDVIITGRSFEEKDYTINCLRNRGIYNTVFFNPLSRSDPAYSREESGKHKARVIEALKKSFDIGLHFEDDPVQIDEIRKMHPDLQIIHMVREDEQLVKY